MPLITYVKVKSNAVLPTLHSKPQLTPRTPSSPPLMGVLGAAFRLENTVGPNLTKLVRKNVAFTLLDGGFFILPTLV